MSDVSDADAEFVAIDVETTGLSLAEDRIVEVGAVRFRASGEVVDAFESLINPLRPSGAPARAVHGIEDSTLLTAEPAAAVLPGFVRFLGDPAATTLVAHNAAVDAGFLGAELCRAGLPLPGHRVVDTLAWSRRVWPGPRGHRLDDLAGRLGLDPSAAHRARADADRARGIFLTLRDSDRASTGRPPLAYPIYDGAGPPPSPCGWEGVVDSTGVGPAIRIEYVGGTRGSAPRDVTPRGFAHRGGVAYLVATCHHDGKVKEFQVERILSRRPAEGTPPAAPIGGSP